MKLSYLWSKVLKKARLSAIRDSEIHAASKVESGSQVVDSRFERHSFCGYDCDISSADIGSFCSIANRVVIGGGRHPIEWVGMSPVFYEGLDSVTAKFSEHARDPVRRTHIGHDVWIGYGAIIAQGIRIGNGAVVGMGSIVTRDVPSYTIVAGNPARALRPRFEEHLARRLEASRWWEFSDEKLSLYAPYFTDPERFLEKLDASSP